MKDEKNIKPSELLETADSASAYAEARLEEVRSEYKKRKIKLMKIGGMMILTSIMLIFATRSWFTMSRTVEGTDASMTASDLPFNLQTIGSQHQTKEALLTSKGYSSGAEVKSNGVTIGNQTTAENGCIYWMLESDDNMYKGIRPGKSGKVEFYIVPKDQTAQLTVNCYINIEPYKLKTELNNENKEVVVEPNELVLLGSDASPRTSEIKSVDLVKGHILFFTNYSPATGLYTGRIRVEENTPIPITITPNDLDESGRYKVTLYWIWPVTLGRILDYNDAVPICSGADETELVNYVQNNPYNFFDISSSSTEGAVIETVDGVKKIKSGVLNPSSDTGLKKHFGELTVAYNNGDLDIGVNAEYILVEAIIN